MNGRFGLIHSALLAAFLPVLAGCPAPQRIQPLYSIMPTVEEPGELKLLPNRTPPPVHPVPLVITIAHESKTVGSEQSVMRHGAAVQQGSSVIIGPPASEFRQPPQPGRTAPLTDPMLDYRTVGYFHRIENYLERALLALGLHAKDRTKFEADLRDRLGLRDDQARMMLLDIPAVIRAVQSGDVTCDYVLQVNEVSLGLYEGEPLQLSHRSEVQRVLRANHGLRLGERGGRNTIPTTLRQPWLQARLNAKLIDARTGHIEWVGEYTLESLNVLEAGLQINIGVRKRPSNVTRVTNAINEHNGRLRSVHDAAVAARRNLDSAYRDAMREITHEGTREEAERIQSQRRARVQQAETAYRQKLAAYRAVAAQRPSEMDLDWTFEYDVDEPVVIPDLRRGPSRGEEDRQRLEHENALLSRLAHDLLQTIQTAGAARISD